MCPVGDQKNSQELVSKNVRPRLFSWGETNGNQQLMEERAECTDEWSVTDVGDQGQRRAGGMEARPSGLTQKELCYVLTDRKEGDADLMTCIFIFYPHHRGNAASYCVCYRCHSVNKSNSIMVETASI